jgi:hypothetical protein
MELTDHLASWMCAQLKFLAAQRKLFRKIIKLE